MSVEKFRNTFKYFPVFSTSDACKAFPLLHRRRLHEWAERGLIKRVVKGYYIFSDSPIDESRIYLIANRIYDPSYISLQSALNWYGLIPEFVPQVTSVSTKKTTILHTTLGDFHYQSIKRSLMFGYEIASMQNPNHQFKIAYPEKALLDLLYLNTKIVAKEQFAELRINTEMFREKVDKERLAQYVILFQNRAFTHRVESFMEFIKYA